MKVVGNEMRYTTQGAAKVTIQENERQRPSFPYQPSPEPRGNAATQLLSCCTSSGRAMLCQPPPGAAPRLRCRPAALHRYEASWQEG